MSVEVLVLGADGMLGSACHRILQANPVFKVNGTSRRKSSSLIMYDAESDDLENLLTENYDYVINCIGVIKQKFEPENASHILHTMRINSQLPMEIAGLCETNSIKAIQIATDCAFTGSRGNYTESDFLDAKDLYGVSKIMGEIASPNVLNLRCSIVGREGYGHHSLLEWFLSQEKGATIHGYTNHYWNGVTSQLFAQIVEGIILNESFESGTFHLLPLDQVSKYDLLLLFRDIFRRNDIEIIPSEQLVGVNRTLATNFPDFNQKLWRQSSLGEVLTIKECIEKLK
jgi:dTDP-4-dehydrorhamnose reductase